MDPFVVPPAAIVLAALAVLAVAPRWIHPAGLLAAGVAFAYAVLVPDGYEVAATFAGFDVVLVSVDEFSRLMGLIFTVIGAAAVLYSWSSDAPPVQTGYALAYVASSLGAVFAGDWLLLVFSWEVMALTSTLLVWHHGGRAVRAGFRYALVHGVGGSLLMAGIIWHYAEVESFLFTVNDGGGIVGTVPQVLVALGIGVNVGFVGLHAWLPDTYPRPHVAASVFLCVYTTKTGVYALYRAFPEGHLWIAYMGGAMALVGVTFALIQNDMRRLLSYHIQSQVGYMVAGIGIGTALATSGAMAHVFNHILYKGLLFMTAGAVIYRTDLESLKKLDGIGKAMPVTAVAFTVAALSISGFPGFNGFVSKGMVLYEAHHYERYEALWWMLLLAGVGTFMSFIKFGYYVFVTGEPDDRVERAPIGQQVAMVSVAILCVVYGLFPDALVAILPNAGAAAGFEVFTIGHLAEGFGLALAGLVGFFAIKTWLERVPPLPDRDLAYNPLTIGVVRGTVRTVNAGVALADRTSSRATMATIRTVGEATTDGRAGVETQTPAVRAASTVLQRRSRIGVGVGIVLVVVLVILLVAI